MHRALALALLLCACTAPNLELPLPSGDAVTIFVPGYKASFLVTGQGERAWVTPGAAISKGDRSLALPFAGQQPQQTFGPLAPDGPLTRFTFFPGLFSIEMYLKWMQFGRDRLPGFIAFSYDWRQDIRASSSKLCALIGSTGKVRVN